MPPTEYRPEDKTADCFVIQGITADGDRFRPSDWAQRLAGVAGKVGRGQRVQAHPLVNTAMVDGTSSLVLRPGLERSSPELFSYLVRFARGNRLRMQPCNQNPEAVA